MKTHRRPSLDETRFDGYQRTVRMRPTVLVVEDDADARECLRKLLEESGFKAVTAENGQQALARLVRRRPRLILLDLNMPIMDGKQFRAELLKDERLARIPVVVLSAESELDIEAGKLNVDAYLEKPIDLRRLFALVHRFARRTDAVVPAYVGSATA